MNTGAASGAHGGRFSHAPVLLQEAIDFLAVKRDGCYVDATLGLGGHGSAIAGLLGPGGKLIGFDKDTVAMEMARARLASAVEDRPEKPAIELLHASFAELAERVPPGSVDGILADLGVSSMQLDNAARGFSFQADGKLDMRMNPDAELSADQVVNQFGESDLADLIYRLGEERRSRRIARAIVRARPIRSTAHLAQVVSAAARPMKSPRGRGIHPATLTFQAIRIYVNRELEDIEALLKAAPRVLKPGGRLVVISFHSLEDRLVKDAIRDGAHGGLYQMLTKKPVIASEEEIRSNARSRSAKLRAAQRL
ncbi:MAG: 16S rRNA (cytosine(1402)-N(4))-methyltransferase RsmH [Acidobacteriota bacterium]|nr:16S rRNA (cytosine(1402)-N(4))-methyltransferase RsmH [Acidobacteriota bacterium]